MPAVSAFAGAIKLRLAQIAKAAVKIGNRLMSLWSSMAQHLCFLNSLDGPNGPARRCEGGEQSDTTGRDQILQVQCGNRVSRGLGKHTIDDECGRHDQTKCQENTGHDQYQPLTHGNQSAATACQPKQPQ